jgi:hypothetical protein
MQKPKDPKAALKRVKSVNFSISVFPVAVSDNSNLLEKQENDQTETSGSVSTDGGRRRNNEDRVAVVGIHRCAGYSQPE